MPDLLRYEATPAALPAVRDHVAAMIEGSVLDEQSRQDLLVAVSEATTNVIRHSGAGHIDVAVEADDREVVVIVADRGRGIGDIDTAMPAPDAAGGRGMPLMAALVADFQISADATGTVVRLVQRPR